MFYADKRLQSLVRTEQSNPVFARALQQANGDPDGEASVQYEQFPQDRLQAALLSASPMETGAVGLRRGVG